MGASGIDKYTYVSYRLQAGLDSGEFQQKLAKISPKRFMLFRGYIKC
jgi:hypothetical protein